MRQRTPGARDGSRLGRELSSEVGLTVRATDNAGLVTTSSPVNITVRATDNAGLVTTSSPVNVTVRPER